MPRAVDEGRGRSGCASGGRKMGAYLRSRRTFEVMLEVTMSALDDGQPQYVGRGVTYVIAAPPTWVGA